MFAQMRGIENADARAAVAVPVTLEAANDGALRSAGQEAAKAHAEVTVPGGATPCRSTARR
jgi:hypothetical protein